MTSPLVGIFVGGEGRRMGGLPKGLLAAPDGSGPLALRLARVVAEALPSARITLVGRADAYAALGLPALSDASPGSGPLGGLVALLDAAGGADVIALATDLPRVTPALLRRLATEHPGAPALAPHDGRRYQPLFARYSPRARAPARTALAERGLSLQPLLTRVGAVTLALSAEESAALDDWDEPADLARGA